MGFEAVVFLAVVFLIVLMIAVCIAYKLGKSEEGRRWERRWEREVPEIAQAEKEQAVKKSRAVMGGHFSEQLAPYLPDFPFKPTEVRFIGKPIDFIVFEGMDEKNISKVTFVEVKSGKSKLSSQERKLRAAIEGNHVEWREYRIPEEVTKSWCS